jgi:peptidoglycan glycosyltransferase
VTPERRIWQIGTLYTLLLLLVSCRLVYWQLVESQASRPDVSDEVAAAGQDETVTPRPMPTQTPSTAPVATWTPEPSKTPQPTFTHTKTPEPTAIPTKPPTPTPTIDIGAIVRGTIYDRNGRRLAYDLDSGNPSRFYAEPSLAHVVGYVSGVRVGVAGIERTFDKTLFGLDDPENPGRQPTQGNDVYLTIDSRVQRAAAQALSDKAGGIVVLDARTGAVLAMASSPAFDPNQVLDPVYIRELEECDGSVSCRQALFNRAAQGLYTPGSTWKTVTLIAALETGQVTPETEFDFGPPLRDGNGRIYYVYTVDGFSIKDPNHREQRLNLVRSYAVSANAAFARIGDEMPPDVMVKYAARLGFGRKDDGVPPIEIDASAARLAINPQELYTNNPLRASTAIGQGELLASPLSMALVTVAIVNDGDIPMPHLAQSVTDPSGNLLAGEPTGRWIRDAMRPETAELVRGMMVQVVRNGSGVRANLPGFVVGGKTGTAQVGDDAAPHAWFTGFVQDAERAIVITVIIENGGEGSQVAAPLFAQVADVVMRHLGEPVEEIVPEPIAP